MLAKQFVQSQVTTTVSSHLSWPELMINSDSPNLLSHQEFSPLTLRSLICTNQTLTDEALQAVMSKLPPPDW